jgi:hypothetical protein
VDSVRDDRLVRVGPSPDLNRSAAKAPIGLEITGTAHIEVPTLKRAFTQEIELACAQRVVLIHSASTPRLTWK